MCTNTKQYMERWKDSLLLIVDQVFMFCVVAPLVVFYWRGTWQLLDIYIYPEDTKTSVWISFCIGTVGMTAMAFLKYPMKQLETDTKCSVKWIIGYHLYTYIGGFGCVNLWRGTWILLDTYTGFTVVSTSVTIAIGQGVLCLLLGFKNCWGPPLCFLMDTDEDIFSFSTRFNTKPKKGQIYLHVMDTLLTTFVIHNLVVFYWRGSWGLLDLLVYPDDLSKTAIVSLIISAGILILLIPVQLVLLHKQRIFRQHLSYRVILDFILYTFANFGAVNFWRAVWFLCDEYLLPDDWVISNWITHIVGFVGCALLLCSASVVVKGYTADGSTLEDQTKTIINNNYFRYFFARSIQNTTQNSDQYDREIVVSNDTLNSSVIANHSNGFTVATHGPDTSTNL